jgi:hypothetical protein
MKGFLSKCINRFRLDVFEIDENIILTQRTSPIINTTNSSYMQQNYW